MSQARREHVMAYTTYPASCREPAVIGGDLRECRLPNDHDGEHASGYGEGHRTW